MKKFYFLLLTLAISSLSFGQVEVFNLAGGGAFPTGWTATNNVTTNDIDRGSYFLLDSGDPSDIIVSAVYDLSAYGTAEFSLDVATFGSGDNNSATIEISYDGGTTYTQTETSAVASGSSYIAGGVFGVTPSAQVVIKLTNTGVSGRGNRLRNLVLTAQEPASVCDGATALTIGTQQCGNTSDFGDLFDDSACLGNYDGGDDYIFSYTATNTGDKLDLTITGQLGWTGFAMSQGCPEGGAGTCVGVQTSSSSGALNFESDALIAGEVYYIQISTYPTPQSTDFCLDAVLIPVPSCLAPADLEVAEITTISANLTWTASPSNETAWNIEYGADGFTQGDGSGTTVAATANPYAFTGLTANTSYDVYLQANCGAGDTSVWVGPLSFTTLCATEIPDYTQGFDSYTGVCWTEATGPIAGPTAGTTSSAWFQDEFANTDALGQSAGINIYDIEGESWLISPTFDLSLGGYEINLDAALTAYAATTSGELNGDDAVHVMQSLDGGSTWSSIYTWDATNMPSNVGDNVTIDISAVTSATVKFALFAFEDMSGNGDYDFFIDNFAVRTPPSCFVPSDLTVTSITTTSASVSWTANSGETAWEYQVVESGATPAETGTATSDNPLALMDLTANTAYDVYVRANCGANGTSEWVTVSFTTECDAVTIFPWTEDFEGITTPSLPSCWSEIDNNSDADFWKTFDTYGVGDSNSVGLYTDYNIDGSWSGPATNNDDYLILPQFALTGNERLKFSIRSRASGEPNDYKVVLSTSGNDPINFTTDLMDLTVATATHTEQIIDLSAYSGNVYIAIHVPADGLDGYYLYVDDFTVEAIPSCLVPTDLAVSGETTTTASVSWTANSGETSWEYQVVENGATPAETGTVTTDNPLALMDLTENTAYDVYVRANCDTNGTSEWVMVSFMTTPAPLVPTYTNDFTDFPGEFWSEGAGALADGPSGTTALWGTGNFAHGTDAPAAYINIYDTNRDEWLISPTFDLSSVNYYLNIDAAATEYRSSFSSADPVDAIWGDDDFVTLMVSEDGGLTWTEIYRWDANNSPGVAGAAMPEVDLSAYSGLTKFAFYAESYIDNEDIDFFIDNFSITTTSLGLEDVNTSSNFTYFPNPVNNVLSIKAQASIDSITVYNMLGQTVVRSTPNTTTTAVDMSGLQTGAYFVQVAINNSIETVRVIKN